MTITHELVDKVNLIHQQEGINKPATCLLVEDDPNDVDLSSRALKKVGVHAMVARTGDEAVRLLDASKDPSRPDFDIVFLDLALKGSQIQGKEVLKHIRRNFPSIHTILVTGNVDQEIMDIIRENRGVGGYVGVIAKPLQKANVEEVIEKHHLPVERKE